MNMAQADAMERLNGRTYEKFQRDLAQNRELLSSPIDRVEERLPGETDKKAAEVRAELIEWMFIFWSTTIITIVAGYLLK